MENEEIKALTYHNENMRKRTELKLRYLHNFLKK